MVKTALLEATRSLSQLLPDVVSVDHKFSRLDELQEIKIAGMCNKGITFHGW